VRNFYFTNYLKKIGECDLDKFNECKELLHQTSIKVSSSVPEWMNFLKFASRIYKYDYTSALLIYSKRPDATALAPEEIWKRDGRYVTSYAAQIPIIKDAPSQVTLDYVYDVSDTGGSQNSCPVPWVLKKEYRDAVLTDLEDRYGINPGSSAFDQRLMTVIDAVVQNCHDQYLNEILELSIGTPLEKLSDTEIDGMIQEFLSDSITLMVYHRIDERSTIPDSLIFDDLPLLNSPDHLAILGTAAISHAGTLLRQMESSIKQVQHEEIMQQRRSQNVSQAKKAKRSPLPNVGNHAAQVQQAPDVLRNRVQELPSGNGAGTVRDPALQSGTDENLPSEGRRGEPVRGNGSGTASESEPTAGNGGHYGNGTIQQLDLSAGPGDHPERRDLLPGNESVEAGAVSDTLNGEPAYNAFINEEDFQDIYLYSALIDVSTDRRQKIDDFYASNPKSGEASAYLKKLFGTEGRSITFSNGKSGFYDFSGKGLRILVYLPEGEYSRSITWSAVQKEIRSLIAEDRFLTPAPAQRPEQLSLFDPQPVNLSIIPPVEQEHSVNLPDTQAVPVVAEEEQEEFLNFDPAELRKSLNDPGRQKRTDDMLRYAEAVNRAFEKSIAQKPTNYHYSDNKEIKGGQKTHYKLNVEAIRLLKQIENADRLAELEEQAILSKYVGWGGIPQAFDKNNDSWHEEYEELKNLLTSEEYEAARASTLTAFYTPPAVIQAVHTALKDFGFTGGNILEPSCGTGRFFGFLPEGTETNSHLYGVELDDLTGRMAKQLYQKAHIQIRGFEKATFPDNFFDVAVGNVPFGEFKVPDRRYDKQNLLIHDYFFAKSLDKVRPGGIIAFVTSKGTMDKANPEVRRYIAQRAELIGAIRLPNTMMKTEANTEVTADLIFLKKRERMVDVDPEWVHLTYLDGGIPVNTYFADHPDMMLGTMAFDNGRYGKEKETTLLPNPQLDWHDELPVAISDLHADYEKPTFDLDSENADIKSIPADPNVKNFSYTIRDDGYVYYRENSLMARKEFSGTRDHRIRGMIGIRDAMREAIRVQSNDFPDDAVQKAQAKLNQLYDAFVRKYGHLTDTGNRLAFNSDSDYPLLCSLENIDDDGNVSKAAIFTKRTIRPPQIVTHVDTAVDAIPHSLNQKGRVDIPYISGLIGKPESQVIEDLTGIIYKDPIDGTYQTSEEYLSGNVRAKLKIAQEIASTDSQFCINVEALQKVQPEDLDASQIDVRLGSPLLESDDVKQFVCDLLNPPSYAKNLKVLYIPSEALWKIGGISHSLMAQDLTASKTYGTHRIDAYELIELSLNQKSPTIRDKNSDGKYILNAKETAAAREKQKIIEKKFEDWVFSDPERRTRLVRKYNDVYNNIRLRQYDGSHLTFPGMTPEITLRTHQKNGAYRAISSGNTLYAHCVGAGKTFTMIAVAMETKRLGLCNKSMFVVPGHLIDQWGSDILRLYPGANVLLATKQDFEKSKRQRLISRIATGDYDAIVIANTSFEKIPVSPERRDRIIHDQINEVTEAMKLAHSEGDEDWTIKQMERTKKSLESQLERLSDQSRKDDLLTFEELGVDQIFVDEAQYYKNLFIASKMTNVAGISQSHALKSTDLLMKCQYVNEINHGQRGVVFATGTPVSNSMSELFVMQKYLESGTLAQMGFEHFDAWAAQFGKKVSSLELTPDGTQYRYKTRFAEFVNLPELMNLYSLVADIQTADQLKLPVPKMKGGKPSIIVAKPSPEQQELVKDIVMCFELIHTGSVDPKEDNALKETNRGRFGALDMRILDPAYGDFEGSNVNLAVQNIFEIWKESTPKLGTQMIFCDLSTPSAVVNMKMVDNVAVMDSIKFSVYYDMKEKLINMGIPEDQVAFIHDAHNEKQKEQLFADMRSGKVRILFGSTARMGAGTNAQRKIVALHHLDCPWRPGDLEQRNGRGFRQGNENDEVAEYRYVTEGTFDAYSWQILEQKQKFISQVSTGRCIERHAQDIDEAVLDYATVKMLSTKDPRIKEREELRVRVAELNALKAQFNSEKYMMEDDLYKFEPQRFARCEQAIQNLTKDIALRDSNTKEDSEIELFTKIYQKRETAGEVILQKANAYRTDGQYLPIGTYRGFRMELTYSSFSRVHSIFLCGAARHIVTLGDDPVGCMTRMDNVLKEMEKQIDKCRLESAEATQRMKDLDEQLKVPWGYDDELDEKTAKLNKLDIELTSEMGADKEAVMDDAPDVTNQEGEMAVEENEMNMEM
jgi:N12 class adenine-specific DNA methylase/adenine-specific DNA methylase